MVLHSLNISLGELHERRLQLETVLLGPCSECGRAVTALDKACRNEVREADGTQWVSWVHAACIGCDASESTRFAGCGLCERAWV